MQAVSQEYRESMKSLLRNRGYIRVIFGFEDQVQGNVSGITGDMTDLSDVSEIFKQGNDTYVYAQLEKDFAEVGSDMLFPVWPLMSPIKEKAYISNDFVSDTPAVVTVTFSETVGIEKMIFNFGDNYPVDFDITYGNDVYEVRDNGQRIVEIENDFGQIDVFTLTVTAMKNDDTRLRIYSIDFEHHLIFDNDKIQDSTLDNSISPINETLPQRNFSVTLTNENHQFDVDNDRSELNLLDTNTKVTVYYGYQLNDESIEWIKYDGLFACDWDADEGTATITARDILQLNNNKQYINGTLSEVSLYDLAEAVCEYMGLDNYHIDEDLQDITITNPLPKTGCKECLQLIANAGCRKLLFKGDGGVSIGEVYDFVLTSNGDKYSGLQGIKADSEKYTYAELEDDLIKIGEDILFPVWPSMTNPYETGFVSEEMSANSGYFTGGQVNLNEPEDVLNGNLAVLEHTLTADEYQSGDDPYIDFTYTEEVQASGVNITFGETICEIFTVRLYKGVNEIDAVTVEDNTDQTVRVNFDVYGIDKIRIEFIKTAVPRNRVRVSFISVLTDYNYTINRNDILGFAKFKKFPKVKEISVPYYSYQESLTEENLAEVEVETPEIGKTYTVELGEPCSDYRLSVSAGSVTILDSNAYWIKFSFASIVLGSSPTVIVYGKKHTRTENTVTKQLNDDGEIIRWENPLISSQEMAEDLIDFLSEYYTVKGSYSFESRGDPALEVNDCVLQEHYDEKVLKVLITDISFGFNGAFSSNMTTLRQGVE